MSTPHASDSAAPPDAAEPTAAPKAVLQAVQQALDELAHLPGALLPILHALQDRLGYVPEAGVPLVAEALNLSRAEVHGVISYYHHFRSSPPGRHVVQVCRAESCQSRGAEALWAQACSRLGCADSDHGATNADASVTLLPVYCLGLCASSPAIAVDERVHARVSLQRFDHLVAPLQTQEA